MLDVQIINVKNLKEDTDYSVDILIRGKETTFKKCLISLLRQSYPNFELIVIDDNSTDNTLQIMNKIKDGLDIDLEPCIQTGKMKIISLTDKPDKWTGKTSHYHTFLKIKDY